MLNVPDLTSIAGCGELFRSTPADASSKCPGSSSGSIAGGNARKHRQGDGKSQQPDRLALIMRHNPYGAVVVPKVVPVKMRRPNSTPRPGCARDARSLLPIELQFPEPWRC
jgi:hypothetical protein